MKASLEKHIIKEKRYSRIHSYTKYIFLEEDITYYASQTPLYLIKRILNKKGFNEIKIIEKGVCKLNY